MPVQNVLRTERVPDFTGRSAGLRVDTSSGELKINPDGTERILIDTASTQTLGGKTFTTPVIGAATGTSLAVTAAVTSSGTAGIGYATGAGGTVTQATDKATGVTLSKVCGAITMHAASLGVDTVVSFTLTNTLIAATDVVVLNHKSGGTVGSYVLNVQPAAGSAVINVTNVSAGALAEAVVISFVVIKAVVA